jgi:hypothetical protein
MRRLHVLAAALALAGCDAAQRLGNDELLAGALLRAPETTVAGRTLPGGVTAQLFFGRTRSAGGTPEPISLEASPEIVFDPGTGEVRVPLTAIGGGYYQATSVLNPDLVWVDGVEYEFALSHAGETYWGRVVAPAAPTMLQGDATTPWGDQVANPPSNPFTVCRAGTALAFASVTGVTETSASVTCAVPPTPTDPVAIAELLLDPSPYQAACFQLPQNPCFAADVQGQASIGYVVSLTALAKTTGGASLSSNLALGSGVFAGASDASAVVLTQ